MTHSSVQPMLVYHLYSTMPEVQHSHHKLFPTLELLPSL
ncbi:hypothetical protein UUU_07160 [Klebsiella pneumoniae subsp. pneumoniae DSM 30104 = JCM 1662 = NBRC 14940]|nr:hypothetical protein UUU_07160 [Klebsiella pneumoniae subsp. pneumoniae DSM 30104 = JCM 1662 = NBRC 14940]